MLNAWKLYYAVKVKKNGTLTFFKHACRRDRMLNTCKLHHAVKAKKKFNVPPIALVH